MTRRKELVKDRRRENEDASEKKVGVRKEKEKWCIEKKELEERQN